MTAIEWTEKTWNPVTGCTVTSPGCKNCYAMKMAGRLQAMNAETGNTPQYEGTTKTVKGKTVWTGVIGAAPDKVWQEPLRRKKPTMYFVNSMGDLFHPNVDDRLIDRAFAIMALSPQHTFQILTKHPQRMREYFNEYRWQDIIEELEDWFNPEFRSQFSNKNELASRYLAVRRRKDFPLPNVWLGVSVEDQKHANARIPLLLDTPAAVRFISAEPLLGPVDLMALPCPNSNESKRTPENALIDSLAGKRSKFTTRGRRYLSFPKLDWVIVGGESGPNSRPMHPDWARSLRDQCAEAGVPYFFKQWGEWLPWGQFGAAAIEDLPEQTLFETREYNFGTVNGSGRWEDVGRPMWMDNVIDDDCVGKVGKKKAGRFLDGVLHNELPSPEAAQ